MTSKTLLILCISLIGSAAAIQPASAQQEFLLPGFSPDEWTIAHQAEDQSQRILEFVPIGEQIETWTELLTVQTLKKPRKPPDIEELAAASHENLSEKCPENVAWNVIERQIPTRGQESILFEWSVKNCPPESDQHEVARIIYGKSSIFRIAYVAKTQALSAEKREKWIMELSATSIVAGR